MKRQDRIVTAARAAIGAPFRLHGRDPENGLDCVGLAVLALARAGHERAQALAPAAYSVRGGCVSQFAAAFRAAGLRPVRKGKAGDLVLVQAGVAQFHLMIACPGGHVHAHAGLGRVVEMPGTSPWPVIARYRWGK